MAKGEGEVAEKIIDAARQHGVAIQQDPDLAQLLGAVELETQIPIEAFVAVAEILSFIYRARNPGARPAPPPRPSGVGPK